MFGAMKNKNKVIIGILAVVIVSGGIIAGVKMFDETGSIQETAIADNVDKDEVDSEKSASEEREENDERENSVKEDTVKENSEEQQKEESVSGDSEQNKETQGNSKDSNGINRGSDGLPDYSSMEPEDFLESLGDDVITEETQQEGLAEDAPAGEFSGNLENSGLKIKGIRSYSGTFIETNEDSECSNVATAFLTNSTDRMISLAVVTISAGDAEWKFEASTIPAGASVIVQEKNQAKYTDTVVSCKNVEIGFEEQVSKLEEKVSIEYTEDGGLSVSNISENNIPKLRIFYKMKDENIYFGGITYVVTMENLESESSQTIYPSHYIPEYGEVLMVREYD